MFSASAYQEKGGQQGGKAKRLIRTAGFTNSVLEKDKNLQIKNAQWTSLYKKEFLLLKVVSEVTESYD